MNLNPFSRFAQYTLWTGTLQFTSRVPTGVLSQPYVIGLHYHACCDLKYIYASMADSAVRRPGCRTITQMGQGAEWCLSFHYVIFADFYHIYWLFSPLIWTSEDKKLSASRGLRPLTPDQGLCPWTPLGAPPSDRHYRLALPHSPCRTTL